MKSYVLFRAGFNIIRLMQSWLSIAHFCASVFDLSNMSIRIILLSKGEENIKYTLMISKNNLVLH
jgi:hypothetical protein